ncbi:unnamed protein product [Lactuca virosa]|uniref:Uncharacterized protein n=1 Tax=Lactuca virosa TaxID=75947 RepID=A0AAU9P5C2_9ASTR|nr:unnamed protein product [Lactuca virosa]
MIRVRLGLYPLLNGLLGWTTEATLDGLVIVSQFTIHILEFEKLPVSIQHQRCAQPSSVTLSSLPRTQRLTPPFLISVVLLPLILIAVASQPQVTLKTRFPCLKYPCPNARLPFFLIFQVPTNRFFSPNQQALAKLLPRLIRRIIFDGSRFRIKW